MSSTSIIYQPHPGVTPEQELDALVAAYRFILDCQAEKKAAERSGQDARKEILNGSGKPSMP